MVNKKGFLRIVEASVAIVIVIGVLFTFYSKTLVQEKPDLSENARNILDELARDVDIRDDILGYDPLITPPDPIPISVSNFVDGRIPENYLTHEIRICEIGSVCGMSAFVPGDIYVGERVISATINIPMFVHDTTPRKIKLFIWES